MLSRPCSRRGGHWSRAIEFERQLDTFYLIRQFLWWNNLSGCRHTFIGAQSVHHFRDHLVRSRRLEETLTFTSSVVSLFVRERKTQKRLDHGRTGGRSCCTQSQPAARLWSGAAYHGIQQRKSTVECCLLDRKLSDERKRKTQCKRFRNFSDKTSGSTGWWNSETLELRGSLNRPILSQSWPIWPSGC